MKLVNTIASLTIALATEHALAQSVQSVPSLINYQGKLTDPSGVPLTPGPYSIQFKLWDSPNAGNASLVWAQQQNVNLLSNGVFNVILGSPGGSPIPGSNPAVNDLAFAFTSPRRFLGLTVVSSNGVSLTSASEILPRQQFLSGAYAISAGNGNPPGTIVAFGGEAVPPGWLMCNGDDYPTNAYSALFAAIGRNWGAVIDPTHFRVPELTGMFLRGWSAGHPNDPDRQQRFAFSYPGTLGGTNADHVGSYQASVFAAHNHLGSAFATQGHQHWMSLGIDINNFYGSLTYGTRVVSVPNVGVIGLGGFNAAGGSMREVATSGPSDAGAQVTWEGGSETRPLNASVSYIIKY